MKRIVVIAMILMFGLVTVGLSADTIDKNLKKEQIFVYCQIKPYVYSSGLVWKVTLKVKDYFGKRYLYLFPKKADDWPASYREGNVHIDFDAEGTKETHRNSIYFKLASYEEAMRYGFTTAHHMLKQIQDKGYRVALYIPKIRFVDNKAGLHQVPTVAELRFDGELTEACKAENEAGYEEGKNEGEGFLMMQDETAYDDGWQKGFNECMPSEGEEETEGESEGEEGGENEGEGEVEARKRGMKRDGACGTAYDDGYNAGYNETISNASDTYNEGYQRGWEDGCNAGSEGAK